LAGEEARETIMTDTHSVRLHGDEIDFEFPIKSDLPGQTIAWPHVNVNMLTLVTWDARHCEERSDAAIPLCVGGRTGLLRFARNDEDQAKRFAPLATLIEWRAARRVERVRTVSSDSHSPVARSRVRVRVR
jgi:hypothetical protein